MLNDGRQDSTWKTEFHYCHKLICTLICTLILIDHELYVNFVENKSFTCKEVAVQTSYFTSDSLSYNIWRQGCLCSMER